MAFGVGSYYDPIYEEVQIDMSPSDHRKIGRLVIFGIPLIILLGLAMPPMVVWTAGEEVVLKASAPTQEETESFVLLQYAIEHVPEPLISDSLKAVLATKDTTSPIKVFGQLDKQGTYHVLTGLTDRKPEHGLYLSGKLYTVERANAYTVDFGLSRFHLLESTEDPRTARGRPA